MVRLPAFRIWFRCTLLWRSSGRDGRAVPDDTVGGKVRFMGENLGVANDLARHIAKQLRKNFGS
jgi:hypothetical protein